MTHHTSENYGNHLDHGQCRSKCGSFDGLTSDIYVVMGLIGHQFPDILCIGTEKIDIVDAIAQGVEDYEYVWVERWRNGEKIQDTVPIDERTWLSDRMEIDNRR
jgi:hypothetical protein